MIAPVHRLALALALLLTLAAARSAAAATVRVDFAKPRPTQPSMVGFTASLGAELPDTLLIDALDPAFWRGRPATAPLKPALGSGVRYVHGIADEWGYPGAAGDWPVHGAPWEHPVEFEAFVRELARAPTVGGQSWEVWNEPDVRARWNGTREQFFETYAVAERALREELGPGAQLVGPNISHYDRAWLAAFLSFCRARGCRVDALAWHERPGRRRAIASIADHLRDARRRFVAGGDGQAVGVRALFIGEVGSGIDQLGPGEWLSYLAALERGRAAGAARACGAEPDGTTNCYNASLDGLLTPRTLQPRATWWATRMYADGLPGRVLATSDSKRISVLGSAWGSAAGGPQVLLGHARAPGRAARRLRVRVELRHLERAPGGCRACRLWIRGRRLAATGAAALEAPQALRPRRVRAHAGRVSLTLAIPLHHVIELTLAPATRPRRVG